MNLKFTIFAAALSLMSLPVFASTQNLVVECTTAPGALSTTPHEGFNFVDSDLVMYNFRGLGGSEPTFYFSNKIFNEFKTGCVLKARNPRSNLVVSCQSSVADYGTKGSFQHTFFSLNLNFKHNVMQGSHLYPVRGTDRSGQDLGSMKTFFPQFGGTESYQCTFGTD